MLTQKDLQSIDALLEKRISRVDERLTNLEYGMTEVKGRITNIESDMTEVKDRIANVESDMTEVKVVILENNVIPRLSTIEECYVDASRRYIKNSDQFGAAIVDIEMMKLAIQKNSADIQELKSRQA